MTASAAFRSLLIATVQVRRPTRASDGAGGSTESTAAVTATVAARLRPLTPQERMDAARLEVEFTHKAYMEAPADVQRGDYLVDTDHPAVRYRVVEVVEPSYMEHHLEVLCIVEVD